MKNKLFLLLSLASLAWVNLAPRGQSQDNFYNPITAPLNQTINDRLSVNDIPTGEGGFARDYLVRLSKGDRVSLDLRSDEFDTVVMLIGDDGSTIVVNDDSAEGGTNSLAFARITESGDYIVRVKTFAATGGGQFSLQITRLVPAS